MVRVGDHCTYTRVCAYVGSRDLKDRMPGWCGQRCPRLSRAGEEGVVSLYCTYCINERRPGPHVDAFDTRWVPPEPKPDVPTSGLDPGPRRDPGTPYCVNVCRPKVQPRGVHLALGLQFEYTVPKGKVVRFDRLHHWHQPPHMLHAQQVERAELVVQHLDVVPAPPFPVTPDPRTGQRLGPTVREL